MLVLQAARSVVQATQKMTILSIVLWYARSTAISSLVCVPVELVLFGLYRFVCKYSIRSFCVSQCAHRGTAFLFVCGCMNRAENEQDKMCIALFSSVKH